MASCGEGLRALYVEDDDDAREVVRDILNAVGFQVVVAATALAALGAMMESHFALVIVDYNLPDATGSELLRSAQARGLLGGASLVVFTAHPHPDLDYGVRLLRKPANYASFLAFVRSQRAFSSAHPELRQRRRASSTTSRSRVPRGSRGPWA